MIQASKFVSTNIIFFVYMWEYIGQTKAIALTTKKIENTTKKKKKQLLHP